ncbi:EpsG family protein [Pseudomonas sp. NPDC089422]|uniref:EpsG family protein n=1 Tax=Pseudomonas sp. NPDC089422 TaxID=3364466 RepID=UPI00382EA99A
MIYLALYSDYFFMMLMSLLVFACAKFMLRKTHSFSVVLLVEFALVAAVVLVAAWGISERPGNIEGDTAVYLNFFDTIRAGGDNPFATFEPGFIWLTSAFAWLGLDARALFFLVPVVVAAGYHHLASRVFGPRSSMTVLVFALILVYPFFLSLTANVIRQGLGMALVFYAVAKLVEERPLRAQLGGVTALLFHRSTVILLPWLFFRRTCQRIPLWLILLIWVGVSLSSYFSMFKILATLVFDRLAAFGLSVNYSDTSYIDYMTGFRWSFWLFSSISIALLCLLRLLGFYYERAAVVFKLSCYFGIVHILTFDLAYNDRFGLYAWMLYPIQVLYLSRCMLIRLSQPVLSESGEHVS